MLLCSVKALELVYLIYPSYLTQIPYLTHLPLSVLKILPRPSAALLPSSSQILLIKSSVTPFLRTRRRAQSIIILSFGQYITYFRKLSFYLLFSMLLSMPIQVYYGGLSTPLLYSSSARHSIITVEKCYSISGILCQLIYPNFSIQSYPLGQ